MLSRWLRVLPHRLADKIFLECCPTDCHIKQCSVHKMGTYVDTITVVWLVLHYAKYSIFRSQFLPTGNLISSHQSVQSVSKSSTVHSTNILFDDFERAICFSLSRFWTSPLLCSELVFSFSLSGPTSPLLCLPFTSIASFTQAHYYRVALFTFFAFLKFLSRPFGTH